MRMSRRAALCANGVVWDKYNYKYLFSSYTNGYKLTDWELVDSGSAAKIYGYEDYDIVLENGGHYTKYVAIGVGDEHESVSVSNPGTVYHVNGFTITKYTLSSNGSYTKHTREIQQTYYIEGDGWKWWVKEYLGATLARDGEYPDEGRGLTYYATDGEYTIMTDGENHYAYKLRG